MKSSGSAWGVTAAALMVALGIAPAAGDGYWDAPQSVTNQESAQAGPARNVVRENKVPGTIESTARRLMNRLSQQGYEVARGYFKLYTIDDCDLSYEVMHTCYGNNPAAPYVLPVVPSWPNEWVDSATEGAFGATAEGYRASYRLDPREAIVILGMMPPPADYFGLQTYLFTRPGKWNEASMQYAWLAQYRAYMLETFFGVVPKNPERLQLFANLSNSINNVVIEEKSNAVWDRPRYFIITPDRSMDGVLRKAFATLGIADADVFTEPIPGDMTIGLDEASDDFLSVIRYAMPMDGGGDGTRSEAWRQRLPLVLLRVRDPQATTWLPYPPVEFEERTGTAPPETALAGDLVALARAVCERWGQPCDGSPEEFNIRAPAFLNTWLKPFLLTGPECVKVGMNCLAPTEDTTYFLSGKLPLDDEQVYAVVGALSTSTHNATYVGLGLNSSLKKLAFDNIPDNELEGSADGFPDVPTHDQFFLKYFARDCSGLETLTSDENASHCYSIGDLLPACYDPSDLACDMLVLSLRGYVRPGTARGAHPELALSPRFIRLRRPQGPDQ